MSTTLPPHVARVIVGNWDTLGGPARAVRESVFVIEQAIAHEEEWDQWDASSLHAVAFDGAGNAAGTGRLLPPEFDPAQPGVGHIGRMAVLARVRRAGTGGRILACLMQRARERGLSVIELHAQAYVADFYARHGFVAAGDLFQEAGIAHVRMRAAL